MSESQNSNIGGLMLAFVGGAILGAGAAVLLTPQSGRKTRRQIGDMVEDAESYAQDLAHEAAEGLRIAKAKGERLIEQAKGYAEEKKVQLAASMDGAKR